MKLINYTNFKGELLYWFWINVEKEIRISPLFHSKSSAETWGSSNLTDIQ